METLENFQILDGYAVFRPTGKVSLDQAVRLVTSAVTYAREHRIRKLMVVVSDLTGFESPSLAMRYWMVHEWAQAAAGSLCIAMVARNELIDPHKFGVTVAANAGLVGDVFESEKEALAWLQDVEAV